MKALGAASWPSALVSAGPTFIANVGAVWVACGKLAVERTELTELNAPIGLTVGRCQCSRVRGDLLICEPVRLAQGREGGVLPLSVSSCGPLRGSELLRLRFKRPVDGLPTGPRQELICATEGTRSEEPGPGG